MTDSACSVSQYAVCWSSLNAFDFQQSSTPARDIASVSCVGAPATSAFRFLAMRCDASQMELNKKVVEPDFVEMAQGDWAELLVHSDRVQKVGLLMSFDFSSDGSTDA